MPDKHKLERDYRFIDPDELDTSNIPEISGTVEECLADALLDIIQLALEKGLARDGVERALSMVHDALARQSRAGFKLHVRERDEPAGHQGPSPE